MPHTTQQQHVSPRERVCVVHDLAHATERGAKCVTLAEVHTPIPKNVRTITFALSAVMGDVPISGAAEAVTSLQRRVDAAGVSTTRWLAEAGVACLQQPARATSARRCERRRTRSL